MKFTLTSLLNCQRVLLRKQNKNNYTDQLRFSKVECQEIHNKTYLTTKPNLTKANYRCGWAWHVFIYLFNMDESLEKKMINLALT